MEIGLGLKIRRTHNVLSDNEKRQGHFGSALNVFKMALSTSS
jgi:hypothetical protein